MSAATETQGNVEKALRCEVERLENLVGSLTQQLQEQQGTIDQLSQQLKRQQERIAQLEEELREQKKLKGRPKIRASQLNDQKPKPEGEGKRPGSAKKSKKAEFEIDEEKIIQPEEIPDKAKFNGYRDYDVQELKIERHNIRFRKFSQKTKKAFTQNRNKSSLLAWRQPVTSTPTTREPDTKEKTAIAPSSAISGLPISAAARFLRNCEFSVTELDNSTYSSMPCVGFMPNGHCGACRVTPPGRGKILRKCSSFCGTTIASCNPTPKIQRQKISFN
jgi:hypothetical protein